MNVFKKALIGAGAAAIIAVIGSSAASAAPIFTVDPTSVGYTSPTGTFNATDLNFTSVATVTQTGATTQTEVGYARLDSYGLNGVPVLTSIDGLASPSVYDVLNSPYYGAYFTFTATVDGISGFGAGSTGTVTSFNFQLYADPNTDTTFTPGTCGATCTDPTVVQGGADLLLAHGTLIVGSAGFQPATGAPTLAATTTFIVDNNAYFAAPVPFYNIALTSTTANSGQVISSSSDGQSITINGINGGANFVPEPLTLSLFGAGLVGAAALRRRKSKKKA